MLEWKRGRFVRHGGKFADQVWTTTSSGARVLRRDAEGSGPGRIQYREPADALIVEVTSRAPSPRGSVWPGTDGCGDELVDQAWTAAERAEAAFLAALLLAGGAVLVALGLGLMR